MKPSRAVCLMPLAVIVLAAGCSSAKKAATTTSTSPTTVAATTTAPTTGGTTSSTAAVPTTATPEAGGVLPAGFTVSDLTWVSDNEGWALGTAPCNHAPCTSTVHTLDGGRTWAGLPAPKAFLDPMAGSGPATVSCSPTVACVHGIRFATATTGYAFGASSLWLTTNGGRTWAQKSKDITDALEVSGGRVVRVTHPMIGCPPGCPYQVEATTVGATSWHSLTAPAVAGVSVMLATEGSNLYVAAVGHIAGGASDAHTQFARSGDGGAHWAAFGDPCGVTAIGSEADATAISAAPSGFLVVGCQPRSTGEAAFVVVSADAGANFGPHRDNLLSAAAGTSEQFLAVSAPTGQRLVALVATASMASLAVSNDAGIDWTVTHTEARPNSGPAYLGFEDALTGRAVINPKIVLTTTDGGGHWAGYSFP